MYKTTSFYEAYKSRHIVTSLRWRALIIATSSNLWALGGKKPKNKHKQIRQDTQLIGLYHIQLLSFWEILALFLLRMILHYSINSSWTWSGIHHRNISNNLIIPQSLHLKKKKNFFSSQYRNHFNFKHHRLCRNTWTSIQGKIQYHKIRYTFEIMNLLEKLGSLSSHWHKNEPNFPIHRRLYNRYEK